MHARQCVEILGVCIRCCRVQELRPVGKCFVKLPKFKVESQLSLKTVLHKLGVKQAFGGSADFSRLSDTKMFVSDVVHKVRARMDASMVRYAWCQDGDRVCAGGGQPMQHGALGEPMVLQPSLWSPD